MPPSDNPDNDSHLDEICGLEWLVWAIEAARRHCDIPLARAQQEEAPPGSDRPDPERSA